MLFQESNNFWLLLLKNLGVLWYIDVGLFPEKICDIGFLKHKCSRCFPVDLIAETLRPDPSSTCNKGSSGKHGSYWVFVAKKNGGINFGDSFGVDPLCNLNLVSFQFDALSLQKQVVTIGTFVRFSLDILRNFFVPIFSSIHYRCCSPLKFFCGNTS